MLRDFKNIDPDDLTDSYDLCVAGTGPAGMTVARKVASKGGRVLLLEAGGLAPSPESRDVYKGRDIGPVPYNHIEKCRLRHFGGTSGHWAGRCAIFDREDFEKAAGSDLPGWPIGYDEVYRHLEEAKSILDVPQADLEPTPLPFEDSFYRKGAAARSTPTRFGPKYKDEIEQSDRIDCLYNANVTDLVVSDDGQQVEKVIVTGYDGKRAEIAAKAFVIAFGAMENARFLLNANTQQEEGVGNQNDMVGRAFMEHFEINFGTITSTEDGFWKRFLDERGHMPHLMPKDEILRETGVGNSVVVVKSGATRRFYGRLAPLREARSKMACSVPLFRANKGDASCPDEYFIGTLMEQVPNRESRIMVDPDDPDQFGKARLLLHYAVAERDWETIEQHAFALGKMVARLNVGRLKVSEELFDRTIPIGAHCHHMGTTRMSVRPEDGVVDKDSRVHGLSNLYMAGASVFSTGGGANPTLTIVSLSLRLGEHLSRELSLS
ncbi:GMC oxidoreductase [Parvularcula maris]|uniref:GMC family oxidoreductase n=1 Tax=Parvularcula maris TaxID=2965077 RepID=A0A9X2L7J3_9PROT|nr:GMC family oxidoreductase [Parvularcula maris]MCQ8184408.1 GMC family oxidoreductase [Parvularcula maris]